MPEFNLRWICVMYLCTRTEIQRILLMKQSNRQRRHQLTQIKPNKFEIKKKNHPKFEQLAFTAAVHPISMKCSKYRFEKLDQYRRNNIFYLKYQAWWLRSECSLFPLSPALHSHPPTTRFTGLIWDWLEGFSSNCCKTSSDWLIQKLGFWAVFYKRIMYL